MLIIGIGHKARQGKDTAARYLRELLPLCNVVRIAFADALKDYCREHYGMKEKDPALLQRVGSEMRERDKDYWITQVEEKIAELPDDTIVVIPDVRMRNEAEWVRRQGGLLINVQRYENGERYIAPDRDPNHPSETDLDDYDDWDWIINASSMLELRKKIVSFLGIFA